jgi:hypothetical protein
MLENKERFPASTGGCKRFESWRRKIPKPGSKSLGGIRNVASDILASAVHMTV